ncbi:MAG: hypothetical protein JNM62_13890 [Flavobacteriales bacterium]|nr:hypothetical protein [Flavobacteriales bacterium]
MRAFLSLAFTIALLAAFAQPGPRPITHRATCDPIPPDSVDITGDGIADLVICGQAGVTTLDKSTSVGMCHLVVRTLPGTQLLSSLHPMGGRVIRGFTRGDTIPALDTGIQDDLRIPRHAFIAGEVQALSWSQGGNTVSEAHRASMADGLFVFAATEAGRVVHGTFRLKTDPKKRTVRIRPGNRNVGLKPVIMR